MQEQTENTKEQAILNEIAALFTDEPAAESSNSEPVVESTPAAEDTVDVAALQAENARLQEKLQEYEEQAQTLFSARVAGLSEQKQSKMNDLFAVLKAKSPLQRLVILNTIAAATPKKGVDNEPNSGSQVSTKPRNLKELRGNLKKILNNANL